jgi:hypothetical protein
VNTTIPWVTTIIGVIAVVLATRGRRGPLVSPFSTCVLVLVSIFGIRPLVMVQQDVFTFYGRDVRAGYDAAALVGLVAVLAIVVGYFTFRSPTAPQVPQAVMDRARQRSGMLQDSIRVAPLLLLMWFLVMIASGGGLTFLSVLFAGRSAESRAALENLPVLVSALPTCAGVLIAAARVETERIRALTRRETIWFWVISIGALVPPLAQGTRRFLLPSLIALTIAVAVPAWNKRVQLRTVLAAAGAFLFLVAVPFVRSAGSRRGRTDLLGAIGDFFGNEGLSGALTRYFLSFDTEMFGYISYLSTRLGNDLSYTAGSWLFGDLVLAPVPFRVLEGMGVNSQSDMLLIDQFGTGCLRGSCPVPSLPGVLLTDFGVVGVGIGMLVVGMVFARFDANLLRASGSRLIVLLTLGGFAPVLMRGNTPNLMWLALNVVIVTCITAAVQHRLRSALTRLVLRRKQSRESQLVP